MNIFVIVQGLLWFALVIGVPAGIIFAYVVARKNRDAYLAACTAQGWSFTDRDDTVLWAWSGDPFEQGHRPSARNVVTGTHQGCSFVAFDYTYYTTETSIDSDGHVTSHEQSHRHGVVGLTIGTTYPPLRVLPENFFGRAVGRLTNTDIQFESEGFNRAFTVQCPDRKFASDVIHPHMMEALLAHPKVSWEFRGDRLASVSSGRLTVEEIQEALTVFDTVLGLLPDFVRHDPRWNPTPL